MVQRGLKVSLGTVRGIGAVMVLTLIFLNELVLGKQNVAIRVGARRSTVQRFLLYTYIHVHTRMYMHLCLLNLLELEGSLKQPRQTGA